MWPILCETFGMWPNVFCFVFFLLFCILLNLICGNFNIFAFSAVVGIHLTIQNSEINSRISSRSFSMSKVLKKRSVFRYFRLFSKNNQPNLNLKYRNGQTKTFKKSCLENTLTRPWWSTKLEKLQTFIPKSHIELIDGCSPKNFPKFSELLFSHYTFERLLPNLLITTAT